MRDFYVSIIGNDNNQGTKESPFRTLECAKNAVNETKNTLNTDINIVLCDGIHILIKPIVFAKKDELPYGKTLTIKAEDDATPVVSGGIRVENWTRIDFNGRYLYKASIPEIKYVRDFFVNNQPREIAKSGWMEWDYVEGSNSGSIAVGFTPKVLTKENMESNQYLDSLGPIYENIPEGGDTIDFENIHNIEQLEFVATSEWRVFIARAKKTLSSKEVVMSHAFRPISSHVENDYGENDPRWLYMPNPRNNNAKALCYFQNDISLIKKPGEFAFDETNHELYYYPLDGENMNEVSCFIPSLEILFRFEGDKNNPVRNIKVQGLTFAHCDCTWYSKKGLAVDQAFALFHSYHHENGKLWLGGYSRTQIEVAMVIANYCENVKFTDCIFENSSGMGILSLTKVSDLIIEKSIFQDIGDTAISLKIAEHCNINNNIINNCCHTNFAGVGILIEDPVATKIEHNDISNLPYSGISVGWGWGGKVDVIARDNSVSFNRIYDVMKKLRDGGAIYGLDKQPGSYWNGNYIYNVLNNFAMYLYFDQGCAKMQACNNVLQLNSKYKKSALLVANVLDTIYPQANHNIVFNNNYMNILQEEAKTSIKSQDNEGNELENIELNSHYEANVVNSDGWSVEAQNIISNAGLQVKNLYLFSKMKTK